MCNGPSQSQTRPRASSAIAAETPSARSGIVHQHVRRERHQTTDDVSPPMVKALRTDRLEFGSSNPNSKRITKSRHASGFRSSTVTTGAHSSAVTPHLEDIHDFLFFDLRFIHDLLFFAPSLVEDVLGFTTSRTVSLPEKRCSMCFRDHESLWAERRPARRSAPQERR